MNRRDFLKTIGIGAAATVIPAGATDYARENITFPATSDWGEITHVEILDNSLIEEIFEGDLTIGLFTTELGADGIGDEVTYNGYERQAISFKGTTNANDIDFPFIRGKQIHVESIGIFRGKNMLFFENITNPVDLHDGDRISFLADNINISFQ